jgi:hypothetical protein
MGHPCQARGCAEETPATATGVVPRYVSEGRTTGAAPAEDGEWV